MICSHNDTSCKNADSAFYPAASARNVLQRKIEVIVCLIAAFLLMMLCTRSSFLYPFNNWDDSNSYFTVGKSIWKGLVPYRDLFDQKGYLFYWLYALASLISYRTFTGVFIVEILAAFASLLAIAETAELYIRRSFAVALTPVAGAIMYSAHCFYWGGCAEEIMLPFLLWGIYLSLRYIHTEYPSRPLQLRTALAGGILAGCIANIKFNSLGLYAAFIFVLAVLELCRVRHDQAGFRHHLLRAFADGGVFLAGMMLAFLPGLIYFGIHHAVGSWFEVYIYDNVFLYSEKITAGEKIHRIYRILVNHFTNNQVLFLWLAIGCIGFLFRRVRIAEKIDMLLMGACLLLGIFIGGVDLPYYPLPLAAFSVFGVITAGTLLQKLCVRLYTKLQAAGRTFKRREGFPPGIIVQAVACTAALCLSAAIAVGLSMNIYFMQYSRDDLWMYQFADIIADSGIEHPTLLNMRCLDSGLYTVTGIVPTCCFFQTQTIKLDDVEIKQDKVVRSGGVDFIVAKDLEPDHIYERYELAASTQFDNNNNGDPNTYYLYRLKN